MDFRYRGDWETGYEGHLLDGSAISVPDEIATDPRKFAEFLREKRQKEYDTYFEDDIVVELTTAEHVREELEDYDDEGYAGCWYSDTLEYYFACIPGPDDAEVATEYLIVTTDINEILEFLDDESVGNALPEYTLEGAEVMGGAAVFIGVILAVMALFWFLKGC